MPHHYFFGYFILFSALIVSIRSDLETMLISRWVSLFLVPVGLTLSFFNYLPITFVDSILGTTIGYFSLYLMAKLFYVFTKKEGIGEGDFELLAFIGSFTGLVGIWFTTLIGSVIGSVFGLLFIMITKKDRNLPIPFGPFLALGAMSYLILQSTTHYLNFF